MAGAQYYFSATKGRLARVKKEAQPTAKVAEVLADLREVIAQGLFVHTPTDKPCKFCDHQHACGKAAPEWAAAKMADDQLAPYRKLAAHE